MKKNLFTCFLALLCLIGSEASSQSRVAESPPGAGLLSYIAGPHREGAILPDTFLYSPALEIDGGPMETPSMGTVVSPWRLSRRQLEAPRRVVSGPRHCACPLGREEVNSRPKNHAKAKNRRGNLTEESSFPIKKTASLRASARSDVSALPSPVFRLPTSSSLVDRYLDSGAGRESYSLQPAPVTVYADLSSIDYGLSSDPQVEEVFPQAVIWGRISEYSERSQVQLTVYPDYFFPSTKAPGSNLLYLPLKDGNIMEGGYPKDKSFQYNLESRNHRQWFSLALGTSPFLDKFLIEAGDSIQVFLNLETNALVFAGPAAEKFKLQQGLARIRAEFLAKTTPVLYTPYPERVLQNPEYRAQMEEAKAAAGPVILIRKRSLDELDELAKYDLYQEDGQLLDSWRWIDSFEGKVPAEYQFFFRKEAELLEWKSYMDKIYSNLLYASKENKDTVFIERAKAIGLEAIRKAETFLEENLGPASAAMMDYLSTKTKLQALILDKDLTEVAEFIPQQFWREKYLVRHFYESYQRISQVDQRLKQWIATMENPIFRQHLEEIRDIQGSGSQVSGFEFMDEQGDLKTFSELSHGDLILVEFWISGCKVCVAFNEGALKALKDKFGDDPRFQVITVSADFNPELWKASLQSGRYTQPEFTNLYTGPLNRNHPFLLRYGISSFPNRILIDREGKIVQASQVPFLAPDLIQLIESYLETHPSTNTKSKP